jgi:hypothetical protein
MSTLARLHIPEIYASAVIKPSKYTHKNLHEDLNIREIQTLLMTTTKCSESLMYVALQDE